MVFFHGACFWKKYTKSIPFLNPDYSTSTELIRKKSKNQQHQQLGLHQEVTKSVFFYEFLQLQSPIFLQCMCLPKDSRSVTTRSLLWTNREVLVFRPQETWLVWREMQYLLDSPTDTWPSMHGARISIYTQQLEHQKSHAKCEIYKMDKNDWKMYKSWWNIIETPREFRSDSFGICLVILVASWSYLVAPYSFLVAHWSFLVAPWSFLVAPWSFLVDPWIIHSGCLVIHRGCLIILSGSLVILSGSLVNHSGSIVIHNGCLVILSGSLAILSGSLVSLNGCLFILSGCLIIFKNSNLGCHHEKQKTNWAIPPLFTGHSSWV